jgi:transcriptional regulator with XRE-family HTH domain
MKETFGYKLGSVREDKGLSIEEVARATGISTHQLEALERDNFAALPGDSIVENYLRAYAQCIDVNAELMIEDYRRERAAHAAEQPTVAARPARFRLLMIVAGIFVIFAVIVTLKIRTGNVDELPPRLPVSSSDFMKAIKKNAAPESESDTSPAVERSTVPPVETIPPPPEEPIEVAAVEPEPTPPAPADLPEPGVLAISEHGVGTGVESRELVGAADRFSEGTQVWFWTRVENGTRGETIDHVWLHEGVEAARVSLTVGGASWRTHSAKTLWPGSAGNWAVEARDESGRTLARSEFTCTP